MSNHRSVKDEFEWACENLDEPAAKAMINAASLYHESPGQATLGLVHSTADDVKKRMKEMDDQWVYVADKVQEYINNNGMLIDQFLFMARQAVAGVTTRPGLPFTMEELRLAIKQDQHYGERALEDDME